MTNNNIDDNRTKKILISNILFKSATIVSQIFLNIFLFKSTDDISLVALFNIVLLSFQLFSFSLFARIVKFGNRNLTHIISLIGLSIVYLFLVVLGGKIIDYYLILASAIGIFNGMYWIGYNNNEFDLTSIGNRGNYQGLKKSLKTVSSILVPSIIGIIIGKDLFGVGYGIAFSIGMLLFLLSGAVGIVHIDYVNKEKYSLIGAVKKVFNNADLSKVVINYFLLGFALSNTLISIILPLLLYTYGITEINLGFIVSFFSILTVIASYLFGKFINYKSYKLTYIISGLVYVISVIILLFWPIYWYVVIFASILNLLFTFMDIPQSVYSANKLHEIKGYNNIKSEYMVIKEIPLMLGRILSFICIYYIGSFNQLGIKVLFGLMALIILLSVILFTSIGPLRER